LDGLSLQLCIVHITGLTWQCPASVCLCLCLSVCQIQDFNLKTTERKIVVIVSKFCRVVLSTKHKS